MSKRETDIAQIRKYLNGELDAKAMHQLERRAQDDPFLMDALEGYETAGSDKQEQLNELADRLQQRIVQKERRIIPWRTLAIAASVLIVFAIGGLWLYNRQPVNNPQIAQVVKPEVKTTPADTEQAVPEKKNEIAVLKSTPPPKPLQKSIKENKASVAKPVPPVAAEIASAAVENKTVDTTAKDTTPLNEMIVMDYTAQKKKKATSISPAGVATSKNIIKGSVTGKSDGLPVVGASVRLAGTNISVVTDGNGHFVLPADSNQAKLIVSYIGYSTQEVNINNKTPVNIALQPTAMLSETVVTGYSSQRKKDIAGSVAVVNAGDATKTPASASEKLLQGQAAGVSISNGQVPGLSFFKASPKNIIKGRVVGKDDELPIAGVSVKVAGTNTGVVTDANGMFSLHADSSINKKLVIAFIGYQTRQVNLSGSDLLKTIILEPANNSLSEVVVTNYGNNKNADETVVTDAHPEKGWGDFRRYLKKNAVSPDGKTGVVKLSFQVDHTGMISDIRVITGLSKETNQKAIALITDGPGWAGSTGNKTEKVTVRVKFVK